MKSTFLYISANSLIAGWINWQGPHQEAVKSITIFNRCIKLLERQIYRFILNFNSRFMMNLLVLKSV